jgi:hypothetical protein
VADAVFNENNTYETHETFRGCRKGHGRVHQIPSTAGLGEVVDVPDLLQGIGGQRSEGEGSALRAKAFCLRGKEF